jgi:transposase
MVIFFCQKTTPTQKGDTGMNYIGVDCHISTLDFAVVSERGILKNKARVKTSVKEFMEFVKTVPKPRKIIIEEGTLASWLLETSLRYGEELTITDPKTNKWIGKSVNKDDEIDAEKLAQLARGGYIKAIYHPVNKKRRFKELVFAYHDTIKSQIRIKNKLKACFRT